MSKPSTAALLCVGVSAFALAASHAQAQTADRAALLEEIIVTAEKREQDLQKVPVAVSAFTAETRSTLGIVNAQDIANFTPGVSISDVPNRVSVRGIGRVTNEVGNDPGVANYVDGFYTSESDVIGSSDFLTERVEILRGPQGTLYGRNSIGGAVNVISNRPTPTPKAEVRATYESYGRGVLQASVSGPMSERLRYRLSAVGVEQEHGYAENLAGVDQWSTDTRYVEGQLEADVTDRLRAWLKVSNSAYDFRPRPSSQIDPYFSGVFHNGLVANPTFNFPSANPSINDPYTVSYDFPGHTQLNENLNITGHVTWSGDSVTLKYIGGYSQYDYYQDRDFDQTSRKSFLSPLGRVTSSNYVEVVRENKSYFSHELNLTSNGDGDLSWIAGLYYYNEKLDQPYAITVPDVPRFENPVGANFSNPMRAYYSQRGRLDSEAYAAFGQASWKFQPTLTLTAGLRYTKDKKAGRETQFQVFYNPDVDPGNTYPVLNQSRVLSDSWSGITGKIGLDWTPDPDTLAYAVVSTGYKSGGFKLGQLGPDPIVDQETIYAYEAGLKRRFGGALQVNAAAFYYDYRDLQVPVTVLVGVVRQTAFVNAPKSRAYGAEAEVTYRPVQDLTLRLVYSYLNAEYREFSGVIDTAEPTLGPQDLAGKRLPQSPENKLTLNASYTLQIGGADLTLVATSSWIGSQYYAVFNTSRYRSDSYNKTDLRAVLDLANGRYRVIGSVRNVFDETSYSSVSGLPSTSGGGRIVTPNLPRIFGIELQARF